MGYLLKIFSESILVGILLLIIFIGLYKAFSNEWPRINLIIPVFLSGFIFHFIFDIFGINKWYCDNYDGDNRVFGPR